ncbi:TPA: hypothetical protein ACVS3B_002842 [Citrobacter braakii]
MQELISQVEELGIEINHTTSLVDAPRDKCVHFREINSIAAAF